MTTTWNNWQVGDCLRWKVSCQAGASARWPVRKPLWGGCLKTWSPRKGWKVLLVVCNVRHDMIDIYNWSDSGAFIPLPRPPPPRLGWRSTATEALECFTRKKKTGGKTNFSICFRNHNFGLIANQHVSYQKWVLEVKNVFIPCCGFCSNRILGDISSFLDYLIV